MDREYSFCRSSKMSFIKSTCITLLSLSSVALAANSFPGGSVSIENRTLDEIYAVAKAESGPLTVVWGGDGTYIRFALVLPELTGPY